MRRSPRDPRGVVGLSGRLDQIGLGTLLTMLEMERRTGAIALRSDAGPRAQLLLRDGRVVRAGLRHPVRLEGRDAVASVLGWTRGEFMFLVVPVEARDEIGCSTSHLLLDAARELDESAAA